MTNNKDNIWDYAQGYLIVRGEYNTSGIFVKEGFDLRNGPISQNLYERLSKWITAYSVILLLDEVQIKHFEYLWIILDNEGIKLSQEVANELEFKLQVKYYSEGQSEFIEIDTMIDKM